MTSTLIRGNLVASPCSWAIWSPQKGSGGFEGGALFTSLLSIWMISYEALCSNLSLQPTSKAAHTLGVAAT